MHFADATNSQLYIDMSFSRSLDETTFPYQTWQTLSISPEQYSLSLFNISYQWINNTCYRIILQPKGYIFLYNATITVTTED